MGVACSNRSAPDKTKKKNNTLQSWRIWMLWANKINWLSWNKRLEDEGTQKILLTIFMPLRVHHNFFIILSVFQFSRIVSLVLHFRDIRPGFQLWFVFQLCHSKDDTSMFHFTVDEQLQKCKLNTRLARLGGHSGVCLGCTGSLNVANQRLAYIKIWCLHPSYWR